MRTPFKIKEVLLVTSKVAPCIVPSIQWLKVSAALQADLQFLQSHLCPSLTCPSLSNLLCTFCSQVEGENHPRLIIARGTNYGSYKWSAQSIFGPRPIFVTVCLVFLLQHTWPVGTVLVLALLCTHDDIILWVRWHNTLCSTMEGVPLVGASRTCSSVNWDDVWAFGMEQVLLCTGWLRCVLQHLQWNSCSTAAIGTLVLECT